MPTVLVVDDDFAFRRILADILHAQGFAVLQASSGKEALMQVRQASAAPDLCIVDFHMGDMNGYDLLHEFRQRESMRSVPILMLSSTNKEIKGLVESEGVSFLSKITDFREIVAKIKQMLGAPADAGDGPAPVSRGGPAPDEDFQNLIVQCLKFKDIRRDPDLASLRSALAPEGPPIGRLVARVLSEMLNQGAELVSLEMNGSMLEACAQSPEGPRPLARIPDSLYDDFVIHIANMAHLDVFRMDEAQQGRFQWQAAETDPVVELGVSMSPLPTGHVHLEVRRIS